MRELLVLLIPVGAFLAALGLLAATGRLRGWRDALILPRLSPGWRKPPASRFGIAWGLAAVAFATLGLLGEPLVWGPLLLLSGIVLAHTGFRVARNTDGWGDTLWRHAFGGRRLAAEPRRYFRSEGLVALLIGLVFVAAGIANVVVAL